MTRFNGLARSLHWLMAALILAMLFIGVGMVSTVSERYAMLVALHRPLGVAILVLAALRLANRLARPVPALPADLPAWQAVAARGSHIVLYALMLGLPLIGWAMQSAGQMPVVLFGHLALPPILPASPMLHAALRSAHQLLAYGLFLVVLVHLGAALMHRLIRRDGVFRSMAP
jgi:cytochrome b561